MKKILEAEKNSARKIPFPVCGAPCRIKKPRGGKCGYKNSGCAIRASDSCGFFEPSIAGGRFEAFGVKSGKIMLVAVIMLSLLGLFGAYFFYGGFNFKKSKASGSELLQNAKRAKKESPPQTFDERYGARKSLKIEAPNENGKFEDANAVHVDSPLEAKRRAELAKLLGAMNFDRVPEFLALVFCEGETFVYNSQEMSAKGVAIGEEQFDKKIKSLFPKGDISKNAFLSAETKSGSPYLIVGLRRGAKIRTGFGKADINADTGALAASSKALFTDYIVRLPKESGMQTVLDFAFSDNLKRKLAEKSADKNSGEVVDEVNLKRVAGYLKDIVRMRSELDKLKKIKKPVYPKDLGEFESVVMPADVQEYKIFDVMMHTIGGYYDNKAIKLAFASFLKMDFKTLDGVSFADIERFSIPRTKAEYKDSSEEAFAFLLQIYGKSWAAYVSKFSSLVNLQPPQNIRTIPSLKRNFEILTLCEKAYRYSRGELKSGTSHASGALARKLRLRPLTNIKFIEELKAYIDDITHLITPVGEDANSILVRERDGKFVWEIIMDKILRYAKAKDSSKLYKESLEEFSNASQNIVNIEKALSDMGWNDGKLPNPENIAEVSKWIFDDGFGVNISLKKISVK